MADKQTRGERNNNPGNIDYNKSTQWQGLDNPPLETGVPKPRFARFKAPVWGIRAIARTLITYQDGRRANDGSKIDSADEIAHRWAPPSENNTSAYGKALAVALGRAPDDETVDVHRFEDAFPLVKAIIIHENGRCRYSDAEITEGLRLAGVVAAKKAVAKERDVQASVVTGVTGIAQTIIQAPDLMDQVQGGIENIKEGTAIKIVVGVLLVALAVYLAWGRMRERKVQA